MRTTLMILAAAVLAACQTTTTDPDTTAPPEQVVLPPYPPGYNVPSKVPEIVAATLPADVTPEQVLLGDDGCYYYHRGATTYPVTNENPLNRYCTRAEPVGQPIDINAPLPVVLAPAT